MSPSSRSRANSRALGKLGAHPYRDGEQHTTRRGRARANPTRQTHPRRSRCAWRRSPAVPRAGRTRPRTGSSRSRPRACCWVRARRRKLPRRHIAAQRNALEDAEDDEQGRRERSGLRISWKKADEEGRRAIGLTVTRNAPLRPRRSPTTPKISAPSGRKAKPAANRASAASNAGVGSRPAKNTLEITGARLPKMKKSYHSKSCRPTTR